MESALPRQTFSWSIERSRIQADRSKAIKLALTWKRDVNSFGDVIWFGYDADNSLQGTAALIGRKIVANAYTPGTLDLNRLGEFRLDCVGLRMAQAAVEAHVAGLADASEAA